jgi:putative PIN family toxin of toxin-antitoxin system
VLTAVLDTNVLVSGVVSRGGIPGQILHAWQEQEFALAVSQTILTEVARTLQDPYFRQRLTEQNRAEVLRLLLEQGILTELTVQVEGIATHPEDDLILATAVSAQADYLVTGDRKLQGIGSYGRVTIISPRAFLAILHE